MSICVYENEAAFNLKKEIYLPMEQDSKLLKAFFMQQNSFVSYIQLSENIIFQTVQVQLGYTMAGI